MCVLVLDAALGLRELVLDSGLTQVTLLLDSGLGVGVLFPGRLMEKWQTLAFRPEG